MAASGKDKILEVGKKEKAMTEEEKKKQQGQGGVTANPDTAGKAADGAQVKDGEAKAEDTASAWKAAADGLRRRAASYREYSQKPVETGTEGQRDYVREFIDSRLARQQETDEERERREKRERTGRRLSALADGLIALSNVTGAMAGATPLKQTSLTAAHKKGVQEALERRREYARQYETARNNAMKLQQKQDGDNAKRRDAEVKARRAAARQADTLEEKAAQLELQGGKADRAHKLAEEKAKNAREHQQEQESQGRQRIALSQERNNISASKGGKKGGNGTSKAKTYTPEHTKAAWNEWWRYTDNQRAEWRRRYGNRGFDVKDDDNLVNAVKQMHDSWKGSTRKAAQTQGTRQKKSVQGFGGKTNGKKKIAGFGK